MYSDPFAKCEWHLTTNIGRQERILGGNLLIRLLRVRFSMQKTPCTRPRLCAAAKLYYVAWNPDKCTDYGIRPWRVEKCLITWNKAPQYISKTTNSLSGWAISVATLEPWTFHIRIRSARNLTVIFRSATSNNNMNRKKIHVNVTKNNLKHVENAFLGKFTKKLKPPH